MRILYVVDHWEALGGIETLSGHIVESLISLGADVEVWSVRETGALARRSIAGKGLAPGGRLQRSAYARWLWRGRLTSLVRRHGAAFDLCVVGHVGLLDAVLAGLDRRRTPCWLWAYGIEVWGPMGAARAGALRAADRVVAISEFTAAQLTAWVEPDRLRVVPCAVDTDEFTPAEGVGVVNRRQILTVGRLSATERYKGHDVLLDALPLVQDVDGEPATLTVIGDGDDRRRLEERCAAMGLGDRVEFRGKVGADELVDAYRRCAVFAMPSRVEAQAGRAWTGEGFGIVYLEAAACGRPVVGSTDGGAPETVQPGVTGLLADPREPQAVAAGISRVLSDPVRADEMGRRGREWVATTFSIRNLRDRIGELVS